MVAEQEDVFYYLTVMNENYEHPEMPAGAEPDILKGMYLFRKGAASNAPRVQLLGSGTIFREAVAAAELLRRDWGVESDLWSCPSFTELARDGHHCTRRHLLNPEEPPGICHVTRCLTDTRGPVIAATDYVRLFAEQIRPFVCQGGRRYTVLGTDGFGRSDTREKLRHFFEVDRYWIASAALRSLADDGQIDVARLSEALKKYGLDADKPNPVKV
jgi:pyruvate dehydrogenase E1 component